MTTRRATRELGGTWFVVPTAFGPDRALDLASQRRLVDAAVSWGVDGLTAMGVTSEASTLSPDERAAALAAIFQVAAGRVPIAVGCTGASVEVVVELARSARAAGAAAAMVASPPLLRNVDALPDFYGRVAAEIGLPLIVQDEPAATGVTMPVGVILAILNASGSRAVKLEDAPTAVKIERLLREDPALRLFGGLGGVSALSELLRGACGTMSGFSFPEILAAVRREVLAGDLGSAGRLFDRYLPLIQFEAQPVVGLSIRKELLRRRGVIDTNVTRGLGPALTPFTLEELDDVLERVGVDPGPARLDVSAWEVT